MKKIHALVFLGTFVLVAAVLCRVYAYPHLAVVPLDLDSKVVAENPAGEPATYFSIPDLAEKSGELGNQTKARVDLEATDQASEDLGRDVAVIDTYDCTDVIAIDCSTTRTPLSATLSHLAIDRSTGEPVAWKGTSLSTGGKTEKGVDFKGLTIKFPFRTQKQTYGFWNADLRKSVPVHFVRETTIDGLAAYEFRQTVEPTVIDKIDVPGGLVDRAESSVSVDQVASSTTSYLVEPETGVIISATSKQDSYAELDGQQVITLTKGTFTTPAAAAKDTVDTYRPLSKALYAVRVIVPIVGSVLGVGLLAIGALLLLRRRRLEQDAPASTSTRSPAHAGSR